MKNNIILIGFMGVGKGTIARALVKVCDNKFAIDTDDLIESQENRKIKKIFASEGEEYFRALEKKCASWLAQSVNDAIISTGGGFYKQENIKSIGKVIYLRSSFDAILERIYNAPNAASKLKKRPLLRDLYEAKALYDIRVPEYEKIADAIVDVEERPMEEILADIMKEM